MANEKTIMSLKDNSQKMIGYAIDFINRENHGSEIENCECKLIPIGEDSPYISVLFPKKNETGYTSLCISYNEISLFNCVTNFKFVSIYKWQSFLLTQSEKDFALNVAPIIKKASIDEINKMLQQNEYLSYGNALLKEINEKSKNLLSNFHLDDLEKEKRFKNDCQTDMWVIHSICDNRIKEFDKIIKDNENKIEYSKICVKLCDDVLALQQPSMENATAKDIVDEVVL